MINVKKIEDIEFDGIDHKEHTGIMDDELCAECGEEEVGFGLYGELCSACDNEMLNQAMDIEGIE